MNVTALHCTALLCTALHFTALYIYIHHSNDLNCASLNYTALLRPAVQCTALQSNKYWFDMLILVYFFIWYWCYFLHTSRNSVVSCMRDPDMVDVNNSINCNDH